MKWPPHKRKRNGAHDGRRYCRFCGRRRRQWRGWRPLRKRWAKIWRFRRWVPICYVCVARVEVELGTLWDRATHEAITAAFDRVFSCNAQAAASG